jgi:hypothetical protein
MHQSPSGASSHSADQEIPPPFYEAWSFITAFTGVDLWVSVQGQMNPIHTPN